MENDKYFYYQKQVEQRKKQEAESYQKGSKERLMKIVEKKFKTAMIASLASIEEHFGHFWGHLKDDGFTDEEEHNKYLWDMIRTNILNRGNTELRAVLKELEQYDIKWNRYRTDFIVTKKEAQNE